MMNLQREQAARLVVEPLGSGRYGVMDSATGWMLADDMQDAVHFDPNLKYALHVASEAKAQEWIADLQRRAV